MTQRAIRMDKGPLGHLLVQHNVSFTEHVPSLRAIVASYASKITQSR